MRPELCRAICLASSTTGVDIIDAHFSRGHVLLFHVFSNILTPQVIHKWTLTSGSEKCRILHEKEAQKKSPSCVFSVPFPLQSVRGVSVPCGGVSVPCGGVSVNFAFLEDTRLCASNYVYTGSTRVCEFLYRSSNRLIIAKRYRGKPGCFFWSFDTRPARLQFLEKSVGKLYVDCLIVTSYFHFFGNALSFKTLHGFTGFLDSACEK